MEMPRHVFTSRSCNAETSGDLPHTPIFSQPVPWAVCSHWLQNMTLSFELIRSPFVVLREAFRHLGPAGPFQGLFLGLHEQGARAGVRGAVPQPRSGEDV